MGATGWLIGRHLRQRWLAQVPLVAIVMLGASGALLAAGAADRTAHAYSEYLERADVADVVLNPGPLATAEIDRVIRELPGVRAATSATLFLAYIDEREGAPRSKAELDADPAVAAVWGSADGEFTDMDRPAIAEGRLPAAPDEVLVNVDLADAQNVDLGDVLPVSFWAKATADDVVADPHAVLSPVGVEHVRVVGIATFPDEVLPDGLYPRARIVVSPALTERYDCMPELPPVNASYDEVVARWAPPGCSMAYRYYSLDVDGGASGVSRVLDAYQREAAAANEHVPTVIARQGMGYNLVAVTTADESERVERATQPVVTALWTLSGVVGAVTAMVLGLAVARELRRTDRDLLQWWQLGATGPQRATAAAVPLLVAISAGVAAAVALAWVLSPVAPVGSVRAVDPSPARDLSGSTRLVMLALAAGCGVLAVALAARAAHRAPRLERSGRPIAPLPRIVWASARPHVDQGLRAAYRGRNARLVLASCSLAAGTFLGTAIFGASLSSLLETPASYGWPWDLAAMAGSGYGDLDRQAVERSLADRDDVESWTELGLTNELSVNGQPVMTVIASDPRAEIDLAVVEGRLPQQRDEVALGARTAADHHLHVGDTVELTSAYLDRPRPMTVTGLAVLPPLGPRQADRASPGNGAVVTEAFDPDQPLGPLTFVGIVLDEHADVRAVSTDLHDAFPTWDAVGAPPHVYTRPVRPAEIVNVQAMRGVPLLVGGLLVASAAVGLAVMVIVSVRSRRHDLAILRALGLTGRQVRTSVRVQTVTIMVAALTLGVPLGVAAGRLLWRAFAVRLGVAIEPSTPVWLITGTLTGALLLAILVAALPARLAARTTPASALRAE